MGDVPSDIESALEQLVAGFYSAGKTLRELALQPGPTGRNRVVYLSGPTESGLRVRMQARCFALCQGHCRGRERFHRYEQGPEYTSEFYSARGRASEDVIASLAVLGTALASADDRLQVAICPFWCPHLFASHKARVPRSGIAGAVLALETLFMDMDFGLQLRGEKVADRKSWRDPVLRRDAVCYLGNDGLAVEDLARAASQAALRMGDRLRRSTEPRRPEPAGPRCCPDGDHAERLRPKSTREQLETIERMLAAWPHPDSRCSVRQREVDELLADLGPVRTVGLVRPEVPAAGQLSWTFDSGTLLQLHSAFHNTLQELRNRIERGHVDPGGVSGTSSTAPARDPSASELGRGESKDSCSRKKTTDKLMREKLAENVQAKDWTARDWSNAIGRSEGAVKGCETWKTLMRLREQAKSERMLHDAKQRAEPTG